MDSRFSECAWAKVAILTVVLLLPVSLRAQASRPQAGCPQAPALFHPCALANAKTFSPPRTQDGRPDIQGFWRGPGAGTESIEEHPRKADDSGGPTMIVDPPDGKIPYQPWARAHAAENREKYVEPNTACFPSGVPRVFYTPTRFEILQSPEYVLFLIERAHTYRIIPMDSRPHAGDNLRLWVGDSRGHWEGNTLVVDVTNQNAKPWFDQAGNFYSAAAHMVERLTLVDANTIHYAITIEDPAVYTRPWTMVFPMRRLNQKNFELPEEACHEGEENTKMLIDLGYRIYSGPRLPAPR